MTNNAFPTDYSSILKRIKAVNLLQYAKTRNYIDGRVSYLSPYISRGVISLRQIMMEIIEKGDSLEVAEKFLQELAWREYYQRIWQEKQDLIWADLAQIQPDAEYYDLPTSVMQGETSIQAVDSAILNLYDSGYMHNHIRMYVASIVCNTGKTYWKSPSTWLYYHLLDGDIASNNASWQWVSGAFSSKKYFCNQENINRFTRNSQQETYLDKTYEQLPLIPVPENLEERSKLGLHTILPSTPFPKIDTSKPTMIYNSYNLDPIWRTDCLANRVLLLEPSHFDKYPVSSKVIEFIINLSANIPGIQILVGEVSDLVHYYEKAKVQPSQKLISKEHPAFNHYPGIKDSYDWMFPQVSGYYSSFFKYWKKCRPFLMALMHSTVDSEAQN